MTGFESLREAMTALLKRRGVAAVTAWDSRPRTRSDGVVAAVSLRSCSALPGGFRDYLGERLDAETGRWQEIYGRKVKVSFGLDLFAPRSQGEAGCQAAFDRLAEALGDGGGQGLHLRSLTRGEMSFEADTGLFRCPAEAECEAWLYAVAEEGGAFLDFIVRGELNGSDGT